MASVVFTLIAEKARSLSSFLGREELFTVDLGATTEDNARLIFYYAGFRRNSWPTHYQQKNAPVRQKAVASIMPAAAQ